MPPPLALGAGVYLPSRFVPSVFCLAVFALLAPGWSGAAVIAVAARIWRSRSE